MREAQAGFRKGYSTSDQILSVLLNYFICQDKRLFCTFVDNSKAVDSINRAMLWNKVISYGVSGKVLNGLLNMYKSIKSCVMNNGDECLCFRAL